MATVITVIELLCLLQLVFTFTSLLFSYVTLSVLYKDDFC